MMMTTTRPFVQLGVWRTAAAGCSGSRLSRDAKRRRRKRRRRRRIGGWTSIDDTLCLCISRGIETLSWHRLCLWCTKDSTTRTKKKRLLPIGFATAILVFLAISPSHSPFLWSLAIYPSHSPFFRWCFAFSMLLPYSSPNPPPALRFRWYQFSIFIQFFHSHSRLLNLFQSHKFSFPLPPFCILRFSLLLSISLTILLGVIAQPTDVWRVNKSITY